MYVLICKIAEYLVKETNTHTHMEINIAYHNNILRRMSTHYIIMYSIEKFYYPNKVD